MYLRISQVVQFVFFVLPASEFCFELLHLPPIFFCPKSMGRANAITRLDDDPLSFGPKGRPFGREGERAKALLVVPQVVEEEEEEKIHFHILPLLCQRRFLPLLPLRISNSFFYDRSLSFLHFLLFLPPPPSFFLPPPPPSYEMVCSFLLLPPGIAQILLPAWLEEDEEKGKCKRIRRKSTKRGQIASKMWDTHVTQRQRGRNGVNPLFQIKNEVTIKVRFRKNGPFCSTVT